MCYCSCIAVQLAGKLHVCQMFVKEANGVVSYLEPSMEIMGWEAKVLGTGLLCLFFYLLCYAAVLKIYAQNYAHLC